ncbi:uncharacterized protein LOC131689608 [Topomyia yanbarensis]|uniref:uncharacterized protein LOC131689608 n=1 Tax=Topomyia yanbarensis TaxID=2498891 RepID=UPI00273B9EAB|nr:uncharacterized protein LOC131689608 [Topomyia yanbarensis]XP_058830826.1 uncharacterized protein LOC131689608 [Topomyia yanbarensis]
MASSLNRFFTKKIDPTVYGYEEEDDESASSGSETETIPEEEDDCDDSDEQLRSVKKRRISAIGGVALDNHTEGKACKLQRNPTRRPNPKISNRNALLARENRRRKKEHVESLEKEVDELKEVNYKIRKEMKRKTKLVEQLTRERNYLKNVIANRTGIMAVLNSVRRIGFPMTSSGLSYVTEAARTPAGSSSDEGFASPHPPMLTDEDNKFNTHDLGLASQEVLFDEEFSRLPDVDELLSTMTGSNQVITTEHNYFEHSNEASLESVSAGADAGGVCVHIVPGGRVSVEFCASCALSSHRAWLEDAQER